MDQQRSYSVSVVIWVDIVSKAISVGVHALVDVVWERIARIVTSVSVVVGVGIVADSVSVIVGGLTTV